jgi:prolyl-tRNA editing enzyme YbaK/EbsC (Cys-tRNA(Pro) deacylase)
MHEVMDDAAVEQAVLDALESAGVAFKVMPCDPALADTAAFCEHYGVDPSDSANTIVVASKKEPKQYVACVLLATTRLDVNGAVKRRMGVSKASFASAEETGNLTGMRMGGVTALALPADMPVWVDSRVMHRDEIVLGGGSRAMKIRLTPAALAEVVNIEIVDDLANPIELS